MAFETGRNSFPDNPSRTVRLLKQKGGGFIGALPVLLALGVASCGLGAETDALDGDGDAFMGTGARSGDSGGAGSQGTGGLGAGAAGLGGSGTGATGSGGFGSGGDAQVPIACTPPASSTILEPIVPKFVGAEPAISALPLQPRPFFAEGSGNTSAADALLSNFDEAEWRAIVPRQSPRDQGIVCPAGGSTSFTWSASSPNQLTCGGQTYNYGSPTGTALQMEVLSGKTVSIPVWNVTGGGTSKLGMLIDRRKAFYLYDQLEILARAYVGTGDDKYARRIAITFDEWAKYLPDYVLTGVNTTNLMHPDNRDPEGGAYRRYQRLSDHNGLAHEFKNEWVLAMDAIYEAESMWSDLDGELGYDVRQFIIDDLLMNHLDYLLNQANFNAHLNTNLSFPYTITARWASVLGRPDIIEWLNSYLEGTIRNFMRDGMHAESMGYSRNYQTENLKVAAEMGRFFEVWPSSPSLDPILGNLLVYEAALQKGIDSIKSVRLPEGQIAPTGNTAFLDLGALTETTSQILPGYGHLTLGDGAGSDQNQVNFTFSDRGNHCEHDVLSFVLHTDETELLSDIRDSRTAGRAFTESTMAHNTVAMNRQNQFRSSHQSNANLDHLFTGGDIFFMEPNLAGISAAEVNGTRAYEQGGLAERYQRLMILNATDPTRPYVVDLFRVKGGTTHDYFLHGSTRWDSVSPPTVTSLSFTNMAGTYPLLEGGETWNETERTPFYGAFRDVKRADSGGAWDVTFEELSGERGARIFMVDDGSVDVFLSRSPSPFRTGSPSASDPSTFYEYWRPTLMARHRDNDGADTLFAAVIEPLLGASVLTSVTRLSAPDDLEHIALRIEFTDGREDVLLASLTDPESGKPTAGTFSVSDGPDQFSLTGHVGIWSTETETPAHLIGGSEFIHPGGTLGLPEGSYEGMITGATRAVDGCGVNALVSDAPLPEGDALRGRFVRATFGTYAVKSSSGNYPQGVEEQSGFTQMYRIDRVLLHEGKTYIVVDDDPALLFEDGVVYETKRPYRSFVGETSFEILLSASE